MPYRAAVLLLVLTAVACGGGGATDLAVDAAVDAAIDAPSIDGPPPCNGMVCNGECVDTTEDEQACGNCTTVCEAGQACGNSTCACAPPTFVIANPAFLQDMILTNVIPMTSLGIGGYITTEIDALIVAMPDAAQLDTPYPLSGDNPGVPPFIGVGYDVDISTMELAASFYATAGTITFTERCAGGFAGTATGLTFTAASGLMPPMLVVNACEFDTEPGFTLTFAFGADCSP